MHDTPLLDYAGLPPGATAALAAVVARHTTLAGVTSWAGPGSIEEIVTQDEYTHDMVIALPPTTLEAVVPRDRRLYLVYDST